MLGKHYLCAVVTQDAANWLTPQSGDVTGSTKDAVVMWANGQRPKTSDQRLRTQVAAEELKHGQAAPASSSSHGSRKGLWLTATAVNRVRSPETMKKCADFRKRNANQNTVPLYLEEVVQIEQSKQWATPDACDHKGATTLEACKQWEFRGQNLPEQTASIMAGKLNPRWVETLMGLPIGWTMPSCTSPQTIAPMSCDSSAMESCLPPQSELLELSLAS